MRTRIAFVATTALVITAFSVAPAQAVPGTPTVENLQTVEGQVSQDVLTDQPLVMAALSVEPGVALTWVPWDTHEGKASPGLDTWGFGPGAELWVAACPAAEYSALTCSEIVKTPFTPVDMVPTVTFPGDTTVGPGQPFEIQVEDFGGGSIFARWANTEAVVAPTLLAHQSTTDLTGPDGSGTVSIVRCNVDHPTICSAPGGFTSPLTRRTSSKVGLAAVPTLTGANPTATPTLQTPLRGTYDVDYHFEKVGGGTVAGESDVTGDIPSNGTIGVVEVDAAALSDGTWDLVVDFSATDTDFNENPLPTVQVKARFTVDRTGPAVTLAPNRSTIHPRITTLTTYPNTATVTASGNTADIAGWIVRDADTDQVVRTYPGTSDITWDGKDSLGVVVDKGAYEVLTEDTLDNPGASVVTLQVTSKHIENRTLTKIVKPAGTVVDKYVGRCSTLRRPAARGWVGSFGYYSNTRCADTSKAASLVSTVHGTQIPSALSYTSLQISAYAGAARALPRSRAVLRYLTKAGAWRLEKLMVPALGWQPGLKPASPATYVYVDPGTKKAYVYWGVYTLSRHRFDVAKFRIALGYRVVVD